MLDFAHDLVLRAIADEPDRDHESPALDALLDTGLVAREGGPGGVLRVTETGHRAIEHGRPSRFERIAWPVAAASGLVFAVATVVDWVR